MKFTRKKVISLAAVGAVGLTIGLSACGGHTNNGAVNESKEQGTDTSNILNNQPLPGIKWSQWRQDLISVEEAESNDTQTTSFVMHQGDNDPIFSCPSVGFPIPVTVSLSNPQMPYQGPINTGPDDPTVGQMDPNGVYMPPDGQGTWLVCLDATGMPYISYNEDNVDAVGGPATWDYTKHNYTLTGAPTAGVAQEPAKYASTAPHTP